MFLRIAEGIPLKNICFFKLPIFLEEILRALSKPFDIRTNLSGLTIPLQPLGHFQKGCSMNVPRDFLQYLLKICNSEQKNGSIKSLQSSSPGYVS
jgi:hypothetical protein